MVAVQFTRSVLLPYPPTVLLYVSPIVPNAHLTPVGTTAENVHSLPARANRLNLLLARFLNQLTMI